MAGRAPASELASEPGPEASPPRRRPPGRDRLADRDRDPNDHDRGAVTVEAALALGSLVLVLVVALGAVGAVMAAVRCSDAARELARLAARGEPERGERVAAALAPDGARITLTREDDTVIAEVRAALLPPLPMQVRGRAVAATEPDVDHPAPTGARQ
jgi:hypothetical protein